MKALVDTLVLLWFQSLDRRLPKSTRDYIEHSTDTFPVSIVSLWEVTIKHALGKLALDRPLPETFAAIERAGFGILHVEQVHLFALSILPYHHRDPFDRMLIAQAKHEGKHLLDPHFKLYDVPLVDL